MINKAYLLVLFMLIFGSLSAQNQIIPCATNDYIKLLNQQNSGTLKNIEDAFFDAKRYSSLKSNQEQDTIYTIKVVFHVVYNNNVQNLNDKYILSQLEELNSCFRRKNADTIDTREIFLSVAADAGINFELANLDPFGNPTSGIVRKSSSLTTFGRFPINLSIADRVKEELYGSQVWDPNKYLNIWICDLSVNGFDALLGYAYPPTNAENWNSNSFI